VPAWRQTGKRDHRIEGAADLSLHHLYRATRNGLAQVAWLGREKENVEKSLFASTRDLFTELDMVFFDTTSIYFTGKGGETLGANGHSKDHRPDLKQMVVGAALDGNGRPVACEMWPGTSRVRGGPDLTPGNKSDAKALVPAMDRLRKRFGITKVTVVADRGMISKGTIADLEERGLGYILGARMRSVHEVKRDVLSRAGRYRTVAENLRVKEVVVEGRRYVVCENPAQAKKDRADREAILASLEDALKRGAKSLVGNRGYRKYLAVERGSVSINRAKAKGEARYDGKFVLRTNVDLATDEVAMKYKELWRVEQAFRTVKSVLDTRPIYHKCDETIKGHVFASFLALVVMHELEARLAAKGYKFEWEDVKRDLEALSEVEVFEGEDAYWLRTEFAGVASKVFSVIGIAAPPTVRGANA
jgi:transposase